MRDRPTSTNPHDALVRYAFSRPDVAEGELRSVLPAAVVNALDFGTLKLEPGTYVDPKLAEVESDILYRVQLLGEPAFVYVLFEHQSTPDPMMPWRMLRYMVRIWEDHLRSHEVARSLPPIIPLVLCHGPRAWTAPSSFHQLFVLPPEMAPALLAHLPNFALLLDDLAAQSSEALLQRAELNELGRLALLALQRAREASDLVSELASWLDLAVVLMRTAQGREDFSVILYYAACVADVDQERIRMHLSDKLGQHAEKAFVTTADRLRAEGEAQGEAKVLLKLLTLRFGELPNVVRARIGAASIPELDVWAERVLSAASLDELLAP